MHLLMCHNSHKLWSLFRITKHYSHVLQKIQNQFNIIILKTLGKIHNLVTTKHKK